MLYNWFYNSLIFFLKRLKKNLVYIKSFYVFLFISKSPLDVTYIESKLTQVSYILILYLLFFLFIFSFVLLVFGHIIWHHGYNLNRYPWLHNFVTNKKTLSPEVWLFVQNVLAFISLCMFWIIYFFFVPCVGPIEIFKTDNNEILKLNTSLTLDKNVKNETVGTIVSQTGGLFYKLSHTVPLLDEDHLILGQHRLLGSKSPLMIPSNKILLAISTKTGIRDLKAPTLKLNNDNNFGGSPLSIAYLDTIRQHHGYLKGVNHEFVPFELSVVPAEDQLLVGSQVPQDFRFAGYQLPVNLDAALQSRSVATGPFIFPWMPGGDHAFAYLYRLHKCASKSVDSFYDNCITSSQAPRELLGPTIGLPEVDYKASVNAKAVYTNSTKQNLKLYNNIVDQTEKEFFKKWRWESHFLRSEYLTPVESNFVLRWLKEHPKNPIVSPHYLEPFKSYKHFVEPQQVQEPVIVIKPAHLTFMSRFIFFLDPSLAKKFKKS